MSRRIKTVVALAALVFPAIASAQTPPPANGILRIGREVLKPGRGSTHAKSEAAWSRALEAAKFTTTFIAFTSMSGPAEVWFVSPFASLAEMEKTNAANGANPAFTAIDDKYDAAETDLVESNRGMILTARPELSYSTGKPLWQMRFLTAQRIQVRAGHGAEFTESRVAIKAAHEKAKLADGFAVYQVTSGMAAGTYYVFAARSSLTELDDNAKTHQDPAYQAALGPDWAKRNAALVQAYEAQSDVNLFAVNPAMSIVPKDWKDNDAFWKPKAPAKKAP